jgi:hypothetical protein
VKQVTAASRGWFGVERRAGTDRMKPYAAKDEARARIRRTKFEPDIGCLARRFFSVYSAE